MLSKCYGSKRKGTKGWFLKLNKDSVLENDYRSFSLMRGNNPRTPLQPYHTKLVAQNFKVFFLHFISNYLQLT